jgi:hypothetical protein
VSESLRELSTTSTQSLESNFSVVECSEDAGMYASSLNLCQFLFLTTFLVAMTVGTMSEPTTLAIALLPIQAWLLILRLISSTL